MAAARIVSGTLAASVRDDANAIVPAKSIAINTTRILTRTSIPVLPLLYRRGLCVIEEFLGFPRGAQITNNLTSVSFGTMCRTESSV